MVVVSKRNNPSLSIKSVGFFRFGILGDDHHSQAVFAASRAALAPAMPQPMIRISVVILFSFDMISYFKNSMLMSMDL